MINCTNTLTFYLLNTVMYRKAIAGAGVVPLLVGLIPHHNEEVAWQAAGALRNMILDNGIAYC